MKIINAIIINVGLLFAFAGGANPDTIHIPMDYPTIQAGINAANDGDVVVVMNGRYSGPGNRDLDFQGKKITVRSQDPESSECIQATIIDAEGIGVVIRFVNDEGPDSVFEGFTLLAGDPSIPVRGIPGLFEFSKYARPTTKSLRVEKQRDVISRQAEIAAEAEPSHDLRLWDGNNPFHQPAATTDYYGSGDVNADGELTNTDVSLAQQMADGAVSFSPRADVDGNGYIDTKDVSLISSATSGGTLPAWWNNLSNRAERFSWLTKVMKIDPTSEHDYQYGPFLCDDFAAQTFINSAFFRNDLYHRNYTGGQTVFNIPMYKVTIKPASGSWHAINAVLVGDDPLNFDDWRFIEPQADYVVLPGMWDMPYGCQVNIGIITSLFGDGFILNFPKVSFYVDETGGALQEYDPDLVLVRPTPSANIPDNRPDLWNPRIIPVDPPKVLFERMRDDLSRVTDIHAAQLPLEDPPADTPLVMSSQFSRLVDVKKGPDGTVHLLWKGKPDYQNGVFYGQYQPDSDVITNSERVSQQFHYVRAGRIVMLPDGEIHLFWFTSFYSYSDESPPTGIYWTKLTPGGWQSELNLAPADWIIPYYLAGRYPDSRDFMQYVFDVAVLPDGRILLVWKERVGETNNGILNYHSRLYHRVYDGQWGAKTLVDGANEEYGLTLSSSTSGNVHLVYWLPYGYLKLPVRADEVYMGNLYHRIFDGSTWSPPVVLNGSNNASCPRMAMGPEDTILLVWEREADGQVFPVWNKYENGMWQNARQIDVLPGVDAWYPTVEFLADGRPAVVWSSRSSDRVTIEAKILETAYTDADQDGTPDYIDDCPDDPDKTESGICGCGVSESDTDGDGALDCKDDCPSDPGKQQPGICGCGISDGDSNGDGTPDCNDACDALLDSDGDGTNDCEDLCSMDPLKIQPGICGCNMSDMDSEADGTPDCMDTNDDNDGLPDEEEHGPDHNKPDFDGNNDGIADCLQSNVASFSTYDDHGYITIESPVGTSIGSCLVEDNPSMTDAPLGVEFPFGFVRFVINGVGSSGALMAKLYLVDGKNVDAYYKYGPTPDNSANHWYEYLYDGKSGAVINGNVIDLHFYDGGRGDDDLTVDGTIVHLGGPGTVINTSEGDPDGSEVDSGSGGGGCFISSFKSLP